MEYHKKFYDLINDDLLGKENLNILEFGVKDGISTSIFLDICKKKKGKVISVDINDHSDLFKDSNWNFIHARDDDYEKIDKHILNNIDVICLDTIHEQTHIKKIIDHYYEKLKVDGLFLIDGISSMPYYKNSYRDNFYSEINNDETAKYLQKLYFNNKDKIDLYFSFIGSGLAKIKKIDVGKLNLEKKMKSRKYSLKNLIRLFLKYLDISK